MRKIKRVSFMIYSCFLTIAIILALRLVNPSESKAVEVIDSTIHYVTGDIGNETWLTGHTYVMCWRNGSFSNPNVTGNLTIQPGVTILFGRSYYYGNENPDGCGILYKDWNDLYKRYDTIYYTAPGLTVSTGTINAQGTEENPIIFKTYTKEGFVDSPYWNNIVIDGDAVEDSRSLTFKYCNFINGGVNNNGVLLIDSSSAYDVSLTVDHCSFNSSGVLSNVYNHAYDSYHLYTTINAIYQPDSDINTGDLTVTNSSFTGMGRAMIYTSPANEESNITIDSNTFNMTGSRDSALVLHGGNKVSITNNHFTGLTVSCIYMYNETMPTALDFYGNDFAGSSASTDYVAKLPLGTLFNGQSGVYGIPNGKTANTINSEYNADKAYVYFYYNSTIKETNISIKNIGINYALSLPTLDSLTIEGGIEVLLEGALRFHDNGNFIVYGTRAKPVSIKNIANTTKEIYAVTTGISEQSIDKFQLSYCNFEKIRTFITRNAESEISIANCNFNASALEIRDNVIESITNPITINHSNFINNNYGVALYNINNINISNCVFEGLYPESTQGTGLILGATLSEEQTGITIRNCLITKYGKGVDRANASKACMENCTVAGCGIGINSVGSLINSIVYGSANKDLDKSGNALTVKYNLYGTCDSYGKNLDTTNIINCNPLFADPDHGDYHLQSPEGRFNGTEWVTTDELLSPCVNAGDPESDYSNEPAVNGSRINLGYYGGTSEASKSEVTVSDIETAVLTGGRTPTAYDYTAISAEAAINSNFRITATAWSPTIAQISPYGNVFDLDTSYTLVYTIKANSRQQFKTDMTATIDGNNGQVVVSEDRQTATVSYTYPKTAASIPTTEVKFYDESYRTTTEGSFFYTDALVTPYNATNTVPTVNSSDTEVATVEVYSINKTYYNYKIKLKITPKSKAGTTTITLSLDDKSDTYQVTTYHPSPITDVTITGVSEPKIGEPVSTSCSIPDSCNYGIYNSYNNVNWNTEDTTFKVGTAYMASIKLYAKTGYSFKNITADKITINGRPATIVGTPTQFYVTVAYTFPILEDIPKLPAKPATPVIASIKATGYNSILLNWGIVSGASGYVIYRATSATGKYTAIKTITSGSTISFIDTGVATGQVYYYKVQAYAANTAGKSYSGFSAVQYGKTVLNTPVISSVKSAAYNNLNVFWGKVAGASGYVVYRATSATGKYTAIRTITSGSTISFIDTGVATGQMYYYKIQAYATNTLGKAYSNLSAVKYGKTVLSTPVISSVKSAAYNSLNVDWGKVAGANGYVVYRATSAKGSYKAIKTITLGTTISYKDTGLTTGKTYYYKVKAYRLVNKVKVYSGLSEIKYAKPALSKPTIKLTKASSTKIKISWSKVSGASGYQIYRAVKKNGTYKSVKTITKGSTVTYTNSSLKKKTTYYYKVRAYRVVSGKKVYGPYSSVKGLSL